ncbi:MAG: molybdate ABC transporter substrate-binding protein [Betaproteobacteria bacterium]
MTFALPRALIALALAAIACGAQADEIQVAVAANFSAAAQKIAASFEKDTGHAVKLSFGATGKFYAQITAGAPFDVLLAADQATPARLVTEGKGVAATRHTYAIGKLVLWSADPALVDSQGEVLKSGAWKHLSVADAKLAPYGAAAKETLEQLKLADAVQARVVTAENIGQAYQFVQTGNAELGFVALGQVQPPDGSKVPGSMWLVPDKLYTPIRQDAVVLTASKVGPAATAFVDYLAGDKARVVIKACGYAW